MIDELAVRRKRKKRAEVRLQALCALIARKIKEDEQAQVDEWHQRAERATGIRGWGK